MPVKPSLGYASRTDAVIALRNEGRSTRAISAALGISASAVTGLEHSAARPKRRPRPAEEMGRTVLFPADVLDSLRPHAAQRGMHVNALARRIVEEVVDDGLVDAVLDDLRDVDEGRR